MSVKPLKCFIDIEPVPPQAYRLPDDGRKWMHLCRMRKAVAITLAKHADPDGSNIWPSASTVAASSGVTRRTAVTALADLVKRGFLTETGKYHRIHKTKMRRLNVAAIVAAGAALAPVRDTVSDVCNIAQVPVQDTQSTCATLPSEACNIAVSPVQDCQENPPILHTTVPTAQVMTAHPTAHLPTAPTQSPATAGAAGGGGRVAEQAPSAALDPLQTQEDEAYQRYVQEWEQENWNAFKRGLPEILVGARLGGPHKEAIQKQVKRYGHAVVLAAVKAWTEKRDLAGLNNKWWAWLEDYQPYLGRAVAQEEENKRAVKLKYMQNTLVPEMESNGYLATASEQDRNNFGMVKKHGAALLTRKDRAKLEAWLPQAENRYYAWQDEQEDAQEETAQ